MFLGKSNLVAVEMASTNNTDGPMCGVKVEADGTTVATDGLGMIIVEPVREEAVQLTGLGELKRLARGGVVFAASVFKRALRNLPGGKASGGVGMQYAAITDRGDDRLELTTAGMGQPEERVSDYPLVGEFMDWRGFVRRNCASGSGVGMRVTVNRKLLIKLLTVMDKACPDPVGYDAVFIEVRDGRALMLKGVNYVSNQRVLGLVMPLKLEAGKWLPQSDWEDGICKVGSGRPSAVADVCKERVGTIGTDKRAAPPRKLRPPRNSGLKMRRH